MKCKKPFERLWISSLTEKAIAKGFKQLKAGSAFDGLYHAGKARSEADWLVGINASQALSISAGDEVYSLGRVQTPTLALICKRFHEHRNFTSTKYWEIQLHHRKSYIDFTSQSSNQWEDRKSAEQILKFIERKGRAEVTDIQIKTVSESAPLLFDLTALQKEANRKLGFSADETLQIAQSLYEKKFITYPRTGSRYIPEDLWTEIPELVRNLSSHDKYKNGVSRLQFGNFNKKMVNDLKVTDHHALLITGRIPSTVSAKEKAVYDMIAYSLLESLSDACVKEVSHITLTVNDYAFIAKGLKILQKGWRAIKGILSDHDENTDSLADLPELKTGDELKILQSEILEKNTQPLKLYTEADVLSAMENAGKMIEDQEQQKAIHTIGIGTPATRASIIETLLRRNYVGRKNKLLIPTQKGLQVFELVQDKNIANVQMTADWEMALHQIEQGELDEQDFLNNIKVYTSQITAELLSLDIPREKRPVMNCPKCRNQTLIIKDKMVKCPDENCSWIQFRNICGVHLELSDIISLLEKGKTSLLKNLKSKAGKKFDASIVLQDDYSTGFEFPDQKMRRK